MSNDEVGTIYVDVPPVEVGPDCSWKSVATFPRTPEGMKQAVEFIRENIGHCNDQGEIGLISDGLKLDGSAVSPTLSPRELATVLAALRHWQGNQIADEASADELLMQHVSPAYNHHFVKELPLTSDEINALCERLNA